jgi:UDP-N-acetylglucosamine acyltransferase
MSTYIDPRAIVSPKAELGDEVKVGPFSIIEDDVVIGNGTEIGTGIFIASGVRIGKNCKIFHGASLGTPPQDLKFKGEKTTLEIGDNTIIREFCTLNRGTTRRGKTIVGNNCFLMAYVHIAHDCVLGNNVIIANSVNLGGHVEIGDYVMIGGLVGIHQFVRIGQHSMIGGGWRVTKDVPPYVMAAREPLIFEGLNIIGLKRRNFPEEVIEKIEHAYKLIYKSDLNVTQALERIPLEVELIPEVQNIIDFIRSSQRGIIPGYK